MSIGAVGNGGNYSDFWPPSYLSTVRIHPHRKVEDNKSDMPDRKGIKKSSLDDSVEIGTPTNYWRLRYHDGG